MIVAISGVDGSGKSTIAKRLTERFCGMGISAVYSRPDFRVCKQFEDSLAKDATNKASFREEGIGDIYFNGLIIDWYTHIFEFIKNHEDALIIMDRYIIDVEAQGRHICSDLKGLSILTDRAPVPEISFFLDVSVSECVRRIQIRGDEERYFESERELSGLRIIYDDILKKTDQSLTRVANDDLEVTLSMMEKAILKKLSEWPFPSAYASLTINQGRCPCCNHVQYK